MPETLRGGYSMLTKHILVDVGNDKTAVLALDKNKVSVESGKSGKLKSSEKDFGDKEDAAKFFEKKEWDLLKKGFVLRSDSPGFGEPVLHFFVGGDYTGALAFEKTERGFYIYKATSDGDVLLLMNADGTLAETVDLPEVLAWDIRFNPWDNSLWLDLDHFIYRYEIDAKRFSKLTDEMDKPASFLSLSDERIAYATHPALFVADRLGKRIFMERFSVEVIKGNIAFCAALSNDGKILAFHNKAGEIVLLNAGDGQAIKTINGDFVNVEQMEFVEGDRRIILREEYGAWKVYFYDVETGSKVDYKSLDIPAYTKEVNEFCLDGKQEKLALRQRDRIHVFDFVNKKLIGSFNAAHMVKTARMRFAGDQLGIRTDYGCFSLYVV
jgi:hypothetical protein